MSVLSEQKPRAGTIVSTGVAGLDEVLYGGLLEGQFYLVEGEPGTRKTALSCNFFWKEPGAASRFCISLGRSRKERSNRLLTPMAGRSRGLLSINTLLQSRT